MASLQKREKILMGLVGFVALFFVVDQFICGDNTPQPPKLAKGTGVQKTITQDSDTKIVKSKSKKSIVQRNSLKVPIEYTTWGRNPFAGAIRLTKSDSSDTVSDNLDLRGIIWKGQKARVLIGDEILKKGGRVGDLEILDIKRDRVICRKGGKIVTLVLKEDAIK